jgi:hypothetical protein
VPGQAPRLSFGDTSIESLLSAVRRAHPEACTTSEWQQLADDAALRAGALAREHRDMATDAPAEQWLLTSSTVLAAYQALAPFVPGACLVDVFLEAMASPFRERIASYLESRFGIADDAPGEAFARISENFEARGEQRFGRAFRYSADVRDTTRNFVNIERCFFNDFFRRNDARELTSIFCALDKVWAEELAKPRYGVRFDRPTTLANGDDACRFQFRKS